jgi:hypothetical protein
MYSSVSSAVAAFFEELERIDSHKRPLTACEDLVLRTAFELLNRNPRLWKSLVRSPIAGAARVASKPHRRGPSRNGVSTSARFCIEGRGKCWHGSDPLPAGARCEPRACHDVWRTESIFRCSQLSLPNTPSALA